MRVVQRNPPRANGANGYISPPYPEEDRLRTASDGDGLVNGEFLETSSPMANSRTGSMRRSASSSAVKPSAAKNRGARQVPMQDTWLSNREPASLGGRRRHSSGSPERKEGDNSAAGEDSGAVGSGRAGATLKRSCTTPSLQYSGSASKSKSKENWSTQQEKNSRAGGAAAGLLKAADDDTPSGKPSPAQAFRVLPQRLSEPPTPRRQTPRAPKHTPRLSPRGLVDGPERREREERRRRPAAQNNRAFGQEYGDQPIPQSSGAATPITSEAGGEVMDHNFKTQVQASRIVKLIGRKSVISYSRFGQGPQGPQAPQTSQVQPEKRRERAQLRAPPRSTVAASAKELSASGSASKVGVATIAEQAGRTIETGSLAGAGVNEARHDHSAPSAADPAASLGYSSKQPSILYSPTGSGSVDGVLSMASPSFGGHLGPALESHEGSLVQGDSPGSVESQISSSGQSQPRSSGQSQPRCNSSAENSVLPEIQVVFPEGSTTSPLAEADAALNPGSPTFALSDEDRAASFRHTNAGSAFLPLHGDTKKVEADVGKDLLLPSSSTGKEVAYTNTTVAAESTTDNPVVVWPGQSRTEAEPTVVWPGHQQPGLSQAESHDPNGMLAHGQMQAWYMAGIKNDVGSLMVPQTWHYVQPPAMQGHESPSMFGGSPVLAHLGDFHADAGSSPERFFTSSELPGMSNKKTVPKAPQSKAELLEEIVDTLIARCESVEKELGCERRANRALRATLEAAQRQGQTLQDQIIWLTQNYWPAAASDAHAQQYQAAMVAVASMEPHGNQDSQASQPDAVSPQLVTGECNSVNGALYQ